jgi:hypothetical protein
MTKLRLSNLKAVSSMIIIDDYQENIYDILLTDVDNPNLQLNENSIRSYKRKIEYVKSSLINDNNNFNVDFYRAMKYFGNFANEVLNIKNINEYDYYRDIMIKIMIDNDKICKERLKGINWITQNPGRQWTSSINPIVSDPREWYGENYIPVITGIPIDIESTLRLFCLPRTLSFWSYLPTEIFNLILFYLSKNYADEAWQYIMI